MYRTIRQKDWFDPDDDSRIKAEAFMRRRPKVKQDGTNDPGDDDGLSVYDSFRISRQACIEGERSCHGVVTLHAGTLRNLGLHVIRDPRDPLKLLIPDMPLENPNDARQEALLDLVADSARIAERRRWRRR
ncbi:MAG TPA: hypothetical protein VMT32_19540 [Bryobacteraceae bacterium]|nr:hypothetical protein [Bryobacteraceae bacterium]